MNIKKFKVLRMILLLTILNSILSVQATTLNSSHTLAGRMGSVFDPMKSVPLPEISHDISAYTNSNLQVRFHFVTNATINSTIVPFGVHLNDVQIQTQVADYSNSYEFTSGTSLSAPILRGLRH